MRSPLPALLAILLVTTGCTTLSNRRDLYFPQTVNGPYTKMKAHGIPKPSAVAGTARESHSGDGKQVIPPVK